MDRRYTFSGFGFGDNGMSVLQVQINNFSDIGTTYTTSIDLELTTEERLALIENLIDLAKKDN